MAKGDSAEKANKDIWTWLNADGYVNRRGRDSTAGGLNIGGRPLQQAFAS